MTKMQLPKLLPKHPIQPLQGRAPQNARHPKRRMPASLSTVPKATERQETVTTPVKKTSSKLQRILKIAERFCVTGHNFL